MASATSATTKLEEVKAEADHLFDKGKFREAAAQYEKLTRLAAADKETASLARFKHGLSRLKDGRNTEAFAAWAQMRMFHPNCEYVPTLLLLEADATSNRLHGEKLCEQILAKYPGSEEAATMLIRRGQAACDQKDYPTASSVWKKFLDTFPGHKSAREVRAKWETVELAKAGKADAAIQMSSDSLISRADELFDRAKFAEAASLYQQALGQPGTPNISHVSSRLARSHLALGHEKEAFQTLQRAVEQVPANATELLSEIVIHTASSRSGDELRMRATQLLVDRYPTSFEAQQALFIAGSVEMTRKNRPSARRWWDQLLTKYPQTAFRAAVEKQFAGTSAPPTREVQKRDQKQSAEQVKISAERRRLENQARWQQESRALAKRYGDPSASVEVKARALFEIAERNVYLENRPVAIQLYQRVSTEFPQTMWAERATFELGQVYFLFGDSRKGLEQLQLFVNRFPVSHERPLAVYCMGNRYLMHEGDLENSWFWYERLMAEYPDHPLAMRARDQWAAVSKLSREEFQQQVSNFKLKKTRL